MNKHTPGPWEYDTELADAGNKSTPMYSEAPGADADLCEAVCIIPHDDMTEAGYKQVKANARLIAAAPELLEALEQLLECSPCQNECQTDDMTCASNVARAAIAKATGQ